MIKKRIAINGFGRIGRNVFRNLMEDTTVEVIAINDLTNNKTLAHLLTHDSIYGLYNKQVDYSDNHLTVNNVGILSTSIRNPEDLPWAKLNIDIVIECTGIFRTEEGAKKHITAGAKKVLLSAPSKGGEVKTIVLGVNEDDLDNNDTVVSNASCTTNCLAPIVNVLNRYWEIDFAYISTVHGYTSDQRLHDSPHRDLRRARAAAINMIPTTTGAAIATAIVIPQLKGKLIASAIRIPIPTGSLIEVVANLKKETSIDEINDTFKSLAQGSLKGIIEYIDDPVVSSDIVGNKHSSIFDSLLTVVNEKMIKITCWYDNESGYSKRLAELAAKL